MRVMILNTPQDVARWAALYILETIERNPKTVLGLPTGGTAEPVYQQLIDTCAQNHCSFKGVTTFNMDEYLGLPKDHPNSYHYFMREKFFQHIDIAEENIHIPDGMHPNPKQACADYEAAITKAGGIDLFFGGLGVDGHIAFNEPGSSLNSRTRVKNLAPKTIEVNSRFFPPGEKVPKEAITVGVGTILDAKTIIIAAHGLRKSQAIYQAIEGSISHLWTVTALQTHPNTILVCDSAAASDLRLKTIRYFSTLDDEEKAFCDRHQIKPFTI